MGFAKPDYFSKSVSLGLVPETRISRRNACLRRGAGHLDVDQSGAADSAAAEVDEVPVARHAVERRILVHRRYHHAVLDHHVAQAERREHGYRRIVEVDIEPLVLHPRGIPLVNFAHERGVAQLEVHKWYATRVKDQGFDID